MWRRPACRRRKSRFCACVFAAVLHDPQFLADAQKARLSINPATAETVQQTVEKLYASPPEVVQRARALIAAPGVAN